IAIVPCSDSDRLCYKTALEIQYWWFNYANGVSKIYDSSEILAENLGSKYNIVAIGCPQNNKYLDKIMDLIRPFRITEDFIEIRGSKYRSDETGIAVVYPNPLSDYKRYIGILGGCNRESIEAIHRLEFTLIPDYLVYRSRDVGRTLNGILETGFFDYWWT
ncbi:MAG: hypothetical protein ABWJ42_00550, partial [Sulfolobales archaeon]